MASPSGIVEELTITLTIAEKRISHINVKPE
jgi:hypothetical protein